MKPATLLKCMPGFLRRYILHFEASVDNSVAAFAAELPSGALVLDAGAGENQYAQLFENHRYIAVDLGVGDSEWDYSQLDFIGDLTVLPLRSGTFNACLNIVTLEHVTEPGRVIKEIARILLPGGRLLLVVPHAWEVHQEPHDYFRFTRHGVRYLLEEAGFTAIRILPVGGFFRLLSRRLLNGLQFFSGFWWALAVIVFAPLALFLPLLDSLDHSRRFTLGYICTAQKSS